MFLWLPAPSIHGGRGKGERRRNGPGVMSGAGGPGVSASWTPGAQPAASSCSRPISEGFSRLPFGKGGENGRRAAARRREGNGAGGPARPGPALPPASGLAPSGGQKMEPRCQGCERQPRQVAADRARLPAAARQKGGRKGEKKYIARRISFIYDGKIGEYQENGEKKKKKKGLLTYSGAAKG